MADIAWPLSTSPGRRPQEGAGRLINVFAEPRGEGLGPVWHRSPGTRLFAATDNATFRGGLVVGGTLFAIWADTIVTIDSSGTATPLDTLSGSDKIFTARNNNAVPDVVFLTDGGTFVYDPSGPDLDPYPDGDLGSPNSVCGHEGYLIFGYGNGDLQASDLNSTNLNTLNMARAESNPDGVVRPVSYNGLLYVFGAASIEVWGYPVNEQGFPLNRLNYNITPGLLAPHAIAGWEPEFGHAPLYVGSDHTVRQLGGAEPAKISPPDLDRLVQDVADNSTLEACCYLANGFAFWELSSPLWTWVYNLTNGKWHERESHLLGRSRFTRSVFAFDKWLTGDIESGDLLEITATAAKEQEAPLRCRIESGPGKAFPNRVRVSRADFDFVTGVGIATGADPIEVDPTVLVSWSDDGGVRWTVPWNRKLGRQGETQQRVTALNTGMSGPMGRRWRLDVSDPVHFGFLGGTMTAEVRAG